MGGVSCCLLAPPSIPRETSAPLRQLLLALLQRNHKDRMDFGERLPGPRQACSARPLLTALRFGVRPPGCLPPPSSWVPTAVFPAVQAVNTPVLQWEVLPPGKPVRRGWGEAQPDEVKSHQLGPAPSTPGAMLAEMGAKAC